MNQIRIIIRWLTALLPTSGSAGSKKEKKKNKQKWSEMRKVFTPQHSAYANVKKILDHYGESIN